MQDAASGVASDGVAKMSFQKSHSIASDHHDGRHRPALRSVLAIAGGLWLGLAAGAVLMELPLLYTALAFLFAFTALVMAIVPPQGQLARSRRAMHRAHWRHHMLTGMGYEDLRLNAWNDYIAAYKDVARQESDRRLQRLSAGFR